MTASAGADSLTSGSIAAAFAPEPNITRISHETTPFNGYIWGVQLIDLSPIQDTWTQDGDGSMWCDIPMFTTDEGDTFELEWEGVLMDTGAQASMAVLGTSGNANDGYIEVRDTDHATNPAGLQVKLGNIGAQQFLNAFELYAQGQHYRARLRYEGTSLSFWLDGVLVETKTVGSNGFFEASYLGRRAGTGARWPVGGTMQNIKFVCEGSGVNRNYPLDEETGTNAADVASGQDGTWSAANKVFVPNNSRYYPMGDDSDTVVDVLGDGSTNGTIENYDAANWACEL